MAAEKRENAVTGALFSAWYLIALQAASRLVTFALNQALLRLATPAAYGTVAIQLELLLNTVLFFAREGVRGAVLRSAGSPGAGQRHDRILRTAVLPLAAGLPLAIMGCWLYSSTVGTSVSSQPHFLATVAAYGVAAVLELASEPMFLLSQLLLDSKGRVRAEGGAVIARAIITVLVLHSGGETFALPAFGAGQIAYALVLLVVLCQSHGTAALGAVKRASQMDQETKSMAYALAQQSLVKQFLQEGDKFAVSRLTTVTDQGSYAVALNYGSLVVRIIFQPIEEAARLYFPRAAGSAASEQEPKQNVKQAAAALSALVHLHLILALSVTAFAPPYVPLLCRLLLGKRWRGSAASLMLRDYVHLLPFLGVNGVLEAFVHSVASKAELATSSRALMVATLLFVVTCYTSANLGGAQATMLATAVGMSYRIVWSSRFASAKVGGFIQWWRPPSMRVLRAFGVAAVVTRMREPHADAAVAQHGFHVLLGSVALLAVCAVIFREEMSVLKDYRRQLQETEGPDKDH